MKSFLRYSVYGFAIVLPVALCACSHSKSYEEQQAAQERTEQNSQAQQNLPEQPKGVLGQEKVTAGSAEIQRQKKVMTTETVREKIPTIRQTTIQADINRMNAKQFVGIGFPSDVAHNIIRYREQNGPFYSVKDMRNVEGVTPSLLRKFDGQLGVAKEYSQAGQVSSQQLGQTSSVSNE